MDYVTLTKEIRQHFGLTSAHITYDNNDYIIMLKKLSDNMILFSCPFIGVRYEDELKLTFNSEKGFVELNIKIECFYESNDVLVIEASFICISNNEFFIDFEAFLNNLLAQKKRKEERILCTQKNLQILNLINVFTFDFKYRQFKGIIKDVSYSALRVLCNPVLLQEKGSLFTFKLKFKNPEESYLFVNAKIIRKKPYSYENCSFAEVVFEIPQNLKFNERLDLFFNQNLHSHSR